MKNLIVVIFILIISSNSISARTKSDVLSLINGDRLTGEILKLEHGKVKFDTESMGTIFVEWNDIINIKSAYFFQIEGSNGDRVVGKIQESNEIKMLLFTSNGILKSFVNKKIIRISQIEDSFLDGVNGSMTFGYSYTKASDIAQLNFGFNASHRTEVREFKIQGSTITTRNGENVASDEIDTATERFDIGMNMTQFRSNRWFNQYFIGFESNDELDLNLRSSIGAGFGRYLIQSNSAELSVIAGLIGTNESLVGNTQEQENLEAIIGIEYSKFNLNTPKIDITIGLDIFPSITESGRIRANLDAKIRREIIPDLFWDLSFYDSYDSLPVIGGEPTNDYGVVTSIGWSF